MRFRWLVFVPILLFAPALRAAEQQVPDANPDARLDRTVTVDVIGTDLGRLAGLLTKQTSVRIRSAKDVADEKVDVFVKDYPLRKLLKNLTSLFGYRWATELRDGETAYLLWRDANTAKRQADLRSPRPVVSLARRRGVLAGIASILAMTDADVRALSADQRAFAEQVRGGPCRGAYSLIASLNAAEREELATHFVLRMPDSNISSEAAGAIVKTYPAGFSDPPPNGPVSLVMTNPELCPGMAPDTVRVEMGDKGILIPLSHDAMVWDSPDSATLAARMRGIGGLGDSCDLSDPRLKKPLKPAQNIGSEEPDRTNWPDFHSGLRRIAESTGIPTVSDYFTDPDHRSYLGGTSAADGLPRFAKALNHEWRVQDGAMIFRDVQWPKRMPAEIPLRIVEELDRLSGQTDTVPQHGRLAPLRWASLLTFEQSLVASELDDDQIESLRFFKWRASWAGNAEARLLLRFLASLSPMQRAALKRTEGLPVDRLPAECAERLAAFYDVRWTQNGYAPEMLSLRQQALGPPTAPRPGIGAVVLGSTGVQGATPVWVDPAPDRLRFVFRIVLPSETKDSEVTIAFGRPGAAAPVRIDGS